jgi:hypothetical protein
VNDEQRFSRDAQRYLDGEPHGELTDAERSEADRLLEAAAAYRESLPTLDGAVDDAVLGAVRRRRPARTHSAWRWLVEPREVRLRPIWLPLTAAAAVLLLWMGTRGPLALEQPAVKAVAADTVFVRFELTAPDARNVWLAGSFNDWQGERLPLTAGAGGVWSTTLALPLGEHQYQFVVDGERWIPDPTAHAQVDDGFGGTNSVIVVGPKGVVRS